MTEEAKQNIDMEDISTTAMSTPVVSGAPAPVDMEDGIDSSSSVSLLVSSPSVAPRSAPKKRRSGIDGLDLGEEIYSMVYTDNSSSKLRPPRKAAQSDEKADHQRSLTGEPKRKKPRVTDKDTSSTTDASSQPNGHHVAAPSSSSKKKPAANSKKKSQPPPPPASNAHTPTQPTTSTGGKKKPSKRAAASLSGPSSSPTASTDDVNGDDPTRLVGELDPATVVHTVHADLEKERLETERKRQQARDRFRKPLAIPRDTETKNLLAQRYRLLQERMSFIKRRHAEFYVAKIVNRYPTPRFPYLDPRNVHLWLGDAETRRSQERILPESRKKLQEEMCTRVLKQEANRRQIEAEAAEQMRIDEQTDKKSANNTTVRPSALKKKPRGKVMKITAADQDESSSSPAPMPLGRQTQNSLADSLALETALMLSSVDAQTESSTNTNTAASSTTTNSASASASSSTSSLQTALAGVSFTRTAPLLRVGNYILFDSPDSEEWEPARIVSVNKARTKIWIETCADEEMGKVVPSRKHVRSLAKPSEDDDETEDDADETVVLGGSTRCVDIETAHFFEYIDVVWCKVKGFDWWPAELCEEVENGVIVPPQKGMVHIAFCEEPKSLQAARVNMILPYYDYCEANATSTKMKKKSFEESFNAAEEVWRNHMWQSILEENERRDREAAYLHRLFKDAPSFYFGKRVAVFWPLDEAWYSGVIKQYNLLTRKHCILYDDDAVEWIDLQREKVCFSPFPLAVHHDAELPTNPNQIKLIYKTYMHQQYDLRDGRSGSTILMRDFLPDYVPRVIEQVDLKDVASDPADAKLVANAKLNKSTVSAAASNAATATSGTAPVPSPNNGLDLNKLNCWECGLDLEKWNGPGLLSAKYGGASNPNKKEEPQVEVISCGRCTKVVHSVCLKLMLKRKNQTEHARPVAATADGVDSTAAANDATEESSSETVLPSHLSCSLANPRCPDCLRCEHCFLISNKSGSVEDLVTCDVCHMRAHLQCIDPAFDPEKHQRPTDGWVCTMCVECRCCGATHSKGGKSTLPPLPSAPGEDDTQPTCDEQANAASVAATQHTDQHMADAEPNAPPPPPGERAASDDSQQTTADEPPPTTNDVDMSPPSNPLSSDSGTNVPAGAVVDGGEDSAAAATVAEPSQPSKRKKTKSKKFTNWNAKRATPASNASTARSSKEQLPFSKRFTSKWVDTDEDEEAIDDPNTDAVIVKRAARRNTAVAPKEEPDFSFWEWTNSFTVCQPCGYRLEKRKFCPICVVIYDRNTIDPMVQCDSCERWVHIACDPNAQANEAKLTKDNTQYHCSECLRRERSDEMTTILDELANNPRGRHFMHPVNETIAPDYFLTIRCPMDFSTVYRKLMELQYRLLDEFRADLNLIWRNAKDYNPAPTAIHKSAVALQQRSTELFKALQEKHAKGGLFDETIGRIEDEEEEQKKAEAERELREAELKRKRQLKRQSEAQFPRPPRLEYYAFYLSFDDIKLSDIDTCLLCGSVGDDADLIFCIDCGECAHSWCYASSLDIDVNGGDGDIDSSLYSHLTAEQRSNFRCPNCQTCSQCGAQEKRLKVRDGAAHERILDSLATCSQCNSIAHISCVPYLHGCAPRPNGPYKCPKCVSCRCCNATVAGKDASASWSADYSLCHACNKLYQSGNVCPICEMVYQPRDESTPMMCCDLCQSWIHMQCDGLKYDQYIELTADASRKYFCPSCRSNESSEQLADRTDKDAARRLTADRRKQERDKLHTHIAFIQEELPTLHTAHDLLASVTHMFDRIHAHQHRLNASNRHQATVMMNRALEVERSQRGAIPPIDPGTNLAIYERQATRTFELIKTAIALHPTNSAPFSIPITSIPAPIIVRHTHVEPMQIELEEDIIKEEPLTEEMEVVKQDTVKMEDVDPTPQAQTAVADTATTTTAADETAAPDTVKPESSTDIDTLMTDVKDEPIAPVVDSEVPPPAAAEAAAMPPLEGATEMDTAHGAAESEPDASTSTAMPVSSDSVSGPAAAPSTPLQLSRSLPSHLALTPDQALSYLESESAHSSRKDDWRICAFCHKKGDQETPKGEGRLLPALGINTRWVHVQCALWTDRVSTNVKGQMNVLSHINKCHDSICTVCSLPGASLRCKRGMSSCGRYHFSCALSRNCLFTIDKEFHCESHSSSKRGQERQAVIDKIARRMLVANTRWNAQGIFAMRFKELDAIRRTATPGEQNDVLSRDELLRHETMLADYISDYEDTGDGAWKRRKLSFASKASLKEEREEAARLNDDDEQVASRPVRPLSERESLLKRYTVAKAASSAVGEEEPAESRIKEEIEPDATCTMEVDNIEEEEKEKETEKDKPDDDKETKESAHAQFIARRRQRDRERYARDRERRARRAEGSKVASRVHDAPQPRSKEIDRLVQSLPPVCPTTPQVFLRVGALNVVNLGEIVPESKLFHDAEYIYPLGYSSTRLFWSYARPGERASYICEILGYVASDPDSPLDQLQSISGTMLHSSSDTVCSSLDRLAPIFRITISDDAQHPILGRSAPEVWQSLMKHFPEWQARNSVRPRMRSGDTFSWSLGGSAFFGLSLHQVMAQVELLPRGDECARYKFKHLQRMIDQQRLESEAREAARIKAGLPEGEYPPTTEIALKDEPPNHVSAQLQHEVHLSGCARTHGYDRRGKAAPTGPGPAPKHTSASESSAAFSSITIVADDGGGGARRRKAMLESTDRRPLKDIPLAMQYRMMKASAPRARVAHSPIHEWGLFANQDLEVGAMVIEYLGELIRPRVADIREKYYEDTGQVSCYMFRIDDDYIVDSTKRGNISRFINHSCDPCCHTECIDTPQGKKIVVLANRAIAKDEEITYNYFFASEDEKIRCACGAINCAGRLN